MKQSFTKKEEVGAIKDCEGRVPKSIMMINACALFSLHFNVSRHLSILLSSFRGVQ